MIEFVVGKDYHTELINIFAFVGVMQVGSLRLTVDEFKRLRKALDEFASMPGVYHQG